MLLYLCVEVNKKDEKGRESEEEEEMTEEKY